MEDQTILIVGLIMLAVGAASGGIISAIAGAGGLAVGWTLPRWLKGRRKKQYEKLKAEFESLPLKRDAREKGEK